MACPANNITRAVKKKYYEVQNKYYTNYGPNNNLIFFVQQMPVPEKLYILILLQTHFCIQNYTMCKWIMFTNGYFQRFGFEYGRTYIETNCNCLIRQK